MIKRIKNYLKRLYFKKKHIKIYGDLDNLKIHPSVIIGYHAVLGVLKNTKIIIEKNVFLSPCVKLITYGLDLEDTNEPRRHKAYGDIILKENCWIASDGMIKGGVTVGKNSVVAAKSLVTKDVPDNVIVAGVPAKIIKKIEIKYNCTCGFESNDLNEIQNHRFLLCSC